jgi:hypothetical protein
LRARIRSGAVVIELRTCWFYGLERGQNLPARLTTPLGRTLAIDDEGDAPERTTLSRGQWQQVALARSSMGPMQTR